MRVVVGVFVSLAGLTLVGGCGSSDDSSLGGGSGVPIADTPKLIATAACDAFDQCWGGESSLVFGGEDCNARIETSFGEAVDQLIAAKKAGTAFYDEQKMQACIDAIAAAGCDIDSALESETCRVAVDGLIEPGGDCSANLECKGDAFCKANAACPGTCTAAGGAGDTCERDFECGAGLYCSDSNKQCTKPAATGDACKGPTEPDCAGGLFCLGADDSGKSGICRSIADTFKAKVGEVCDPTGPFCEPSASCGITGNPGVAPSFQCIAKVGAGQTCQLAFPDSCPTDQYCNVVPDTFAGTCTPLPAAGDPCVQSPLDSSSMLCAPYTRCDAGTCRALQKLGGSCHENATCYSESCLAGACVSGGACE